MLHYTFQFNSMTLYRILKLNNNGLLSNFVLLNFLDNDIKYSLQLFVSLHEDENVVECHLNSDLW